MSEDVARLSAHGPLGFEDRGWKGRCRMTGLHLITDPGYECHLDAPQSQERGCGHISYEARRALADPDFDDIAASVGTACIVIIVTGTWSLGPYLAACST